MNTCPTEGSLTASWPPAAAEGGRRRDEGRDGMDSFQSYINHGLTASKPDNHLKLQRLKRKGLNPGEILSQSLIV